jgi:hypothetical protein
MKSVYFEEEPSQETRSMTAKGVNAQQCARIRSAGGH